MNASGALIAAVMTALDSIPGLAGTHEAGPIQAAIPSAVVATGMETDWGHKSGAGRELRLSVMLRDEGESPVRLRILSEAVQAALDGLEMGGGWRLVTFVFVRSIVAPQGAGKWSAGLDYRARMLAET